MRAPGWWVSARATTPPAGSSVSVPRTSRWHRAPLAWSACPMAEPYVGDLGIAMQFVQSWLGGSSPTFAAMGGSSSSIIMGEWPGGTPPATTQAFLFPEPGDWDRVQPEVFLGQCQVHVDILSSPTGLRSEERRVEKEC